MKNSRVNLIDWRARRCLQQQRLGISLLMASSIVIIAVLLLFRFHLLQTANQYELRTSSTTLRDCHPQQIKNLQQQLQHIQHYRQWWQIIKHQHNQRASILKSVMHFTSTQLLFNRINFLDHQWQLEGYATSAHQYQQLLKHLNGLALDYPFKLGQVIHTPSGRYRFNLIGTPCEKTSINSTTTAVE
ncbi:MAG: hypothetical protein P1U63_10080 [Coxiellaceae bacterium]|nr:hypothetical protein [Coxiellaceae bacterium]